MKNSIQNHCWKSIIEDKRGYSKVNREIKNILTVFIITLLLSATVFVLSITFAGAWDQVLQQDSFEVEKDILKEAKKI